MRLQRRKSRASSIVETVTGLIVIIPLMLIFVDLVGCIMCQTANNALAKEAARAAAEQTTSALASNAAQNVVDDFSASNTSMFTGQATLVTSTFDTSSSGVVIVSTTMTCHFPFPIWGVPSPNDKTYTFGATVTEPIVALLPGQ